VTQTLSDLPAGYTFDPIEFVFDAGRSRAYRDAVGDAGAVYDEAGLVPPLAVAALALGGLLNQAGLPPGALHVMEALEWTAPVPAGARIECTASLAQRSQRSGWIVTIIESHYHVDGAEVMKSRASVMSPAAPS
jgi:acyl dehydratase